MSNRLLLISLLGLYLISSLADRVAAQADDEAPPSPPPESITGATEDTTKEDAEEAGNNTEAGETDPKPNEEGEKEAEGKDGEEDDPTDTVEKNNENKQRSKNGTPEIYEGVFMTNMGIGVGTFCVIVFSIVGVVICFFKGATKLPTCMVLLGIIIPVLVFLIIYSLPIKSIKTDKNKSDQQPTDMYFVITLVFSILIFVACCGLFIFVWAGNLANQIYAQRQDTTEPIQMAYKKKPKNIDEMELVVREAEAEQEINDYRIAQEEERRRQAAHGYGLGATDPENSSLLNRDRSAVSPIPYDLDGSRGHQTDYYDHQQQQQYQDDYNNSQGQMQRRYEEQYNQPIHERFQNSRGPRNQYDEYEN